jgi:hypothetical protein
MINMNMFVEFMIMISKINMFKIDLSRFLKNASRFFLLSELPKETK